MYPRLALAAALSRWIASLLFGVKPFDPLTYAVSAAVIAVVAMGVPASQWAFGWLTDALRDFDDSSKDSDLPVYTSDWRVSRRTWCQLYGLPTWIITIP